MDESWLPEAMKALQRAVAVAGSQPAFAARTGLKQQTISYRLRHGIPLKSAEEVLLVEAAFGVSRHDLRADMFPREKCFDRDCLEHANPREGGPSAPAAEHTPRSAAGPSSLERVN